MRVLYHFRTQGRGAEGVHIAGVVRAFEKLGHTVECSSPTGADPRVTGGTDPFGDPREPGFWSRVARSSPRLAFEVLEIAYNVTSLFANWRRLRGGRCDLVYERHAFFLCSTAWLARRTGTPFVVEVNELVGDERIRAQPVLSALAKWCDRFCFRRADLIVVVSPHLQRRIAALGVPRSRLLVLPNAVAGDAYAQAADGAAVRARLDLVSTPVVGFVGWLVNWHRLEALLEAFAGLSPRTGVVLVLVGGGPLRRELTELADRLGVASRVVFTGPVAHRDVPAYIAAMDVAVIPHSNEFRSPIKLFEYMGQGTAVVAPRTEPIAAVVRDGVSGLLFEPGDAGGLGRALERLLEDGDLRERLGRQAREDVLSKHTWRHNVARVLTSLERLRQDGEGRESRPEG